MAYWKDNIDSYKCSNCGWECSNPNKSPCGPDRCPICSARMDIDGEKESKKKMIVYVIETSRAGYDNGILPVGYTSLEAAQDYIMSRDDDPIQITPMEYKATEFLPGLWKEYMYYSIHKIEIV